MLEVTVPQVLPEAVAFGSVTNVPWIGSPFASTPCVVSAVAATLAGHVSEQVGVVGLLAGTVESVVLLALPASVVSLPMVSVLLRSEPLAMLALTL